jgi:hypothetical protein
MPPAAKERVDIVLGWLANQGPQTVLLFLILCGGGYITTKIVPVHLQQIQEGYERIEARQTEQIKVMQEQHEKDMERMERIYTDKHKPFAGAMN